MAPQCNAVLFAYSRLEPNEKIYYYLHSIILVYSSVIINQQMQSEKSLPEHVSFEEAFAVFAPLGEINLNAAIEAVTHVITYCRENNVRGLLVDARHAKGLKIPTVTQKYWYTQEWAKASGRYVAIALVVPAAMIDPSGIGVTMAANAGLRSDVFDNREDAVEWLMRNLPNSPG